MPRMSVYVSDRRDIDIINALADIPEGDRSWYLKELIRDGLRYRNGIEPPATIVGRSTQVILPGAPLIEPKQVAPKTPKKKKVVKEEPKVEPKIEPKEEPVVEEVVIQEEPKIEPIEVVKEEPTVEKVAPVIKPLANPMDAFANIDLEALKKQAEEDGDDDDIDEKLDNL